MKEKRSLFSIGSNEFAEFFVGQELMRLVTKTTAFYPTKRNYKNIDFLLLNEKGQMLKVQVKHSRHYWNRKLGHCTWFKKFKINTDADLYCFATTIPLQIIKKGNITKCPYIILVFTPQELRKFFNSLKQIKNTKNQDLFFGYYYENGKIYISRGGQLGTDISKYSLENRISDIKYLFKEENS